MKDNNNKLFGGLGPEKAGELGGSAHHKCRGRECDEKAAAHEKATHAHENVTHAKDQSHHDKSKAATTHKANADHAHQDHSKDKHAKAEHKAGSKK